jgi:hypothetical protein
MTQPLMGICAGADKAVEAARRFGADFLDLHFGGDETRLPAVLNACDAQGTGYILNYEGAPVGWVPSVGLKAELESRPGFAGFMLDEADHMQINAHWPLIDYYGYDDAHYLVETEGMDLYTARDAVLDSLRMHAAACRVGDKRAAVEHLFPVMMHTAAKAGFNVSPKVLKETCGPAMLAVALGAARQYQVDVWVDVDYWWHNEVIGHSLERFQSALQLAYWSGADRIYVEGGAAYAKGHPLGAQIENAYAEFIGNYIPAHPRPYDWRSYRPEIGIIRYDDTCFDIRQAYLGEYPGPLYGHFPAGSKNTEWLNIWSLLSHGFVRTDSLSHQWESRRFNSRTLFVPLDNVVVYDDEVSAELLEGLKLIFLTGMRISQHTLAAVEQRVRQGALCVLPPRLAPSGSHLQQVKDITHVPDGKGAWLVVPEFYRLHYECFFAGPAVKYLRDLVVPLIGDGDHLNYRFGDYQVSITQQGGDYPRHELMTCFLPLTQAGANPDVLEVDVRKI